MYKNLDNIILDNIVVWILNDFLCVIRNVPYLEDYRQLLVAVVDKFCLIKMCVFKGLTPIFSSFCIFRWVTHLIGCREINIETKRADVYSTW